jgi:hypothetical protein
MKHKHLLFPLLCFALAPAFAQTRDSIQTQHNPTGGAPIPIELFAGNKALTFQLIVSKQFSPKSRLGFFNVTNFMSAYEKVNPRAEFFSQSLLTAEVGRGISVTTGLSASGASTAGYVTVRPTAGLQYLFANPNFMVVVLPRFDLTQTHNFETFAIVEYKPKLSKNWGIYTRLQGLYNYNTQLGFHEVSSFYSRVGASYKNVQFGLGTNHDFYGPDADAISNFGLFIKTDLL